MSLTRYGLQRNPFGEDLVNPLECPDHLPYYITVEGFGNRKDDIDTWAAQPMTKTQFFLIYGESGTGRTTVCNYIAGQFRKSAQITKVVKYIRDSDHIGVLHEWMDELSYQARDVFLEAHLKDDFRDQITNRDLHRSVTPYKRLLNDAIRELKAKGMRVVAIFENVVNSEIFTLVQEVFDPPGNPLDDIALVIFTTVEKDIQKDFDKLNPRPSGLTPIELQALTSKEVLEFISQRWKQVQAYPPQPFEEQAVVDAFNLNQEQYSCRRVVEALEFILNRKIQSLQQGEDWPNDQSLKINRGEIFEFLYEFEHIYLY